MSETDRDLEALAQELPRYRSIGAPASLRSRVRAEIMSAPIVARPAPRRGWLGAFRPLLATLLVVAVLAATAGAAAAGSLPGDPAFPIKRAVEDVQVALATDDAGRLDALTALLDRRLAELETVAARKPAAVPAALAEYDGALTRVERQLAALEQAGASAARDAAIARALAAAAEHLARLRALASTLPPAAQPGIERAIDAQQKIHGADRAPTSPRTPGTSPSAEPARTANPGGAPGTDRGATPSARPSSPPRPVSPGRP